VAVLLRTRPGTDFWRLSGELRLRVGEPQARPAGRTQEVAISFNVEDLPEVDGLTGLTPANFIARHNEGELRILATGFAPGFVYCGFHPEALIVPRRVQVRAEVPAGTVLFAAGQTAITATPIRTGWHVIGRTEFQ